MIDGVDNLGEPFILAVPPLQYDRRGDLVEAWVILEKDWLPEYQAIPVPVFTEWWP